MNRAIVHFGIQCFQLRDVHRVGVFRTGGYADNLTGIEISGVADADSAFRRLPSIAHVVQLPNRLCKFGIVRHELVHFLHRGVLLNLIIISAGFIKFFANFHVFRHQWSNSRFQTFKFIL